MGCHIKVKEPSLLYYLVIAGGRIVGFITFTRVLCEMHTVLSGFETLQVYMHTHISYTTSIYAHTHTYIFIPVCAYDFTNNPYSISCNREMRNSVVMAIKSILEIQIYLNIFTGHS